MASSFRKWLRQQRSGKQEQRRRSLVRKRTGLFEALEDRKLLAFDTAVHFPMGGTAFSAATADVNLDGHTDVVTANHLSQSVSVRLGDGSGGFGANATFPVGSIPVSVVVADFNGDGKPDLSTANFYSHTVSIMLGTGTGSFGAPTYFTVGANPFSVAAADFNGDGKVDVAVANSGSHNVSVLLGDGTGGLGAPTFFSANNTPRSLTVGDFNGDGKVDVAAANYASNDVSILLGNGAGGLGPAANFFVGSGPRSIAAADFNRDGKLDLVADNFLSTTVGVLLGDGTGSFGSRSNISFGAGTISLSVADYNRDGKLDIAGANFNANSVTVRLGNGDGTFDAANSYVVGTQPAGVASGDFDGDGKADIVSGNFGSSDISVLLNAFPAVSSLPFGPATNFAVGDGPYSVAVGDINGDGKQDLVTANFYANTVSVLLGNGIAGFAAPMNFIVGDEPTSVAIGDLNGDGKLDIVATGRFSEDVSVLLGDGAGGFAVATHFSVDGIGPVSVTVGDFNRDGKQDLATATKGSDSVSILLGDGLGGYAPATLFEVGHSPAIVRTGDFNRDGRLDIVTANSDSDDVSVLLGDGTGSFSAATNFAVGDFPTYVTVGDFNRDGKQDLATTDFLAGTVSVLLGDGAGGFSAPTTIALAESVVAVESVNLNGDGQLDLAVTNGYSGTVSVLLGDGLGGFSLPTDYPVGDSPYSIAVGDFNGDGQPDLVTANYGSNNVSLLLIEAEAPSLVVTTSSDIANPFDNLTSLREAIAHANTTAGADTITFGDGSALAGGTNFTDATPDTITLGGSQLTILSDLTITGPGADLLAIDGNARSRVFWINDGNAAVTQTVLLSGMTIRRGSATSEFGVFNNGGGIQSGENLTIENAVITMNHSANDGGAIEHGPGLLTLRNTLMTGNTAVGEGGAIINFGGTVLIEGSTFSGNSARTGGAIYNYAAPMTLRNVTISGNNATLYGGGVVNVNYDPAQEVKLQVINSTISGNSAEDGGGIGNYGGFGGTAAISLTNSTVSGNVANQNGGGIHNEFAGVEHGGNATTELFNSTITDNHAANDNSEGRGGGIYNVDGFVLIANSIVAENYMGSGTTVAEDIIGDVTANFSLIGNSTGATIIGADNLLDVDPLLGPLADNGGPTLTHALLPGSPAIDAGSLLLVPADVFDLDGDSDTTEKLPFDQRGNPYLRDVDFDGAAYTPDIGAYEAQLPDAFVVTTLDDEDDADTSDLNDLSLREALRLANANSNATEITFASSLTSGGAAVITLGGTELMITTDVTITGPGAQLLTVSGNNTSRVFNVDDGDELNVKSVALSGLTISGGRAIGFFGYGGGIRNIENLTISNSTITGNSADRDGGGVYSDRRTNTLATLRVQNSTVSNSAGRQGGGISGGFVTVEDSTIRGNSATWNGGGLHSNLISTVQNSTINENHAGLRGGGIFSDEFSTMTLQHSTISGNTTGSHHGGGLYIEGSTTVMYSTISGNSAVDGGGLYVNRGPVTILNSTISGNLARERGGGIYNDDRLTLRNVTVSGNRSAGLGGGLFNWRTIVIENSTFTLNHSDNDNDNSLHTGGGIAPRVGSSVTMHNTIVANNFRGSGTTTIDDVSNTVVATSSFNLIGTGGAGGLTNGTNGNLVGVVDALLTPLQDNGGLTLTHALLPGSPAINAGSNAAVPADTLDLDGDSDTLEPIPFDQRGAGFNRLVGTVDIGAFELVASAIMPEIATTAANANNLAVVPITVDFGEAVTGFDETDLDVSGATVSDFISQGNGLFSFNVAPIADGVVTINIPAAAALDTNGVATLAAEPLTFLSDRTTPTSRVNSLPFTATQKSFAISVTGNDNLALGNPPFSNVKEYEVYVALGRGEFQLWQTLPADSPTATFAGESGKTYFFRSIAIDNAGNRESKGVGPEATTSVPDLDAPSSSVTTVDSSQSNFVISFSGSDASSGLQKIELFVSVNNAAPISLGTHAATTIVPGATVSGTATYQAISDGNAHTYRFWTVGTDRAGNVESAPVSPADISTTATFAPPAALEVRTFRIRNGTQQRSFIRHIDLQFNTETGLSAMLNAGRITLTRFQPDGQGAGTPVSLTGLITQNGSGLTIDFGPEGIGGNRISPVGNGTYFLSVDTDGDGTADQEFSFHRLFGDADGDLDVDGNDVIRIGAATASNNVDGDIDGSGKVDPTDRSRTQRELNKRVVYPGGGSGEPETEPRFVPGSAWQNIIRPLDVNDNDSVTPLDALLLINALNASDGSADSQLPDQEMLDVFAPVYYDVNGDRLLTPLDALLVINAINQSANGEGEDAFAVPFAISLESSMNGEDHDEDTDEDEQLRDLIFAQW